MYITQTPSDVTSVIAEAIVHREAELQNYDINATNYTVMLASLPSGEWPDAIKQYAGMQTLSNVPDADVDLVSQYQYRDRIRQLLRDTKCERNKSQLVLDALISQLPKSQVTTLVLAAKARIDGVAANVATPALKPA